MKLDDFTLITPLFPKGIDPKWCNALMVGDTQFFDDNRTLVNHYIDNGICVINSITSAKRFNRPTLFHLRDLLNTYDAVIIASSKANIAPYLAKTFNLSYNDRKEFYFRSIEWVE